MCEQCSLEKLWMVMAGGCKMGPIRGDFVIDMMFVELIDEDVLVSEVGSEKWDLAYDTALREFLP